MSMENRLPATAGPIARGPLIERHRRAGAQVEMRAGWEIAVRYPHEPAATETRVVDLSHRPTFEINGPDTSSLVSALCGNDLPVRHMHVAADWEAYRLTPGRAILFGRVTPPAGALDVTGGWASLALYGPAAEPILNKITAVDLRLQTLPVGRCCQGPVFGVNTLFGRFSDRFELHVCGDSAEFFWDVLFDAGSEFGLAPAGSA